MAKLITERLTLRPFQRGDAANFARLAGDWAVASMTSDIPYPLSADQAQLWLKPMRGEVRYAIEHQGMMIGGVGFYRRPSGSAELGFWLGRPWWGQGFAIEATRAVVAAGFRKHRVPFFTSAHFVDNPASQNVLRKLGFEPTGHCRIGCTAREGDVEAATYQLNRADAAQFIPLPPVGIAPLHRLREFVQWVRRGPDRGKQTSSGFT